MHYSSRYHQFLFRKNKQISRTMLIGLNFRNYRFPDFAKFGHFVAIEIFEIFNAEISNFEIYSQNFESFVGTVRLFNISGTTQDTVKISPILESS